MKISLVSLCAMIVALALSGAAPAFAQQQPPTSPIMAQVVAVHGNTVVFRTADGRTYGVDIPPGELQMLHIQAGMQARLIPLPQGHVRVELLKTAAASPCPQAQGGAQTGNSPRCVQ